MPVGYARRLEPKPGIDVDWTVLTGGVTALVAVVVLSATVSAWRVARHRRVTNRPASAGRHGRLFSSLPAPVALGLTAGTGARPGDGTLSGRLTVVVAATGLIAALVVGAGIERLTGSPNRFGWNWDGELVVHAPDDRSTSATDLRAAADRIAADPDVEASAIASYTDAIELGGVSVPAFAVEPVSGSLEPTLVSGDLPRSPDELVLGREALIRLGLTIGDDVVAVGADGDRRELRVVGQAVFPVIADNGYATSAGLTLAGLEQLNAKSPEYRHLIRVVRGASVEDVLERFEHLGDPNLPEQPAEILNLDNVGGYPRVLAAGFALLVLLCVAHDLAIGVRGRRRDLAVLRALGFVPSQVRATVRWWAVAITGLGLGLGIIFGTLVGGRLWAYLADRLGVANDPSFPFRAIGLIATVAAIIAVGVAAVLGSSATRSPIADLRAE